MNKLLTRLKIDWPILIIVLLTLGIVVTNYTPGTWLTGWDNLHPEFDFKLNVYRSLVAVWQEYQGVGLLGGMAHASDLPRQLFLWGTSFLLPLDTLRYFYHFLMLPVGMLGIYFLLDRILLTSYPTRIRKISSLLGAVFYTLNLGTIQYFYVPFEPYSTFWGLFPWELLTLLLFLKQPTKRNFLYFALANLLAIPQAYVQTIFLVYALCTADVLAISFFEHKSKAFLRTAGIVLGTIFVINAFWLLPNLYFVATNLHVTTDAIQNQMATEKFFQMNKARGTILDLPLLREFYYDFFDFNNTTGKFDYMMQVWRNQFNSPLMMLLGYALFGIVVIGVITNIKHRRVFLGLSLLCLLIFLSNTPGISLINALFRALPLVNQILRNPFTKFIVPLVTLFGLGLGMGSAYLMEHVTRIKRYQMVTPVVVALLILATTFPVFKGYFLSPSMRQSIPKEYFDLFSYMKTQDPSSRIMNLPQGSFWGWYYYRFGVRGSGFLWYGLQQPILDRAFDVWSRENEDYYWQLSYALQKRDQALFNQILEKYQIPYVLFDQNILFADNINSVRYAFNQEELAKQNPKLTKVASFGKVQLYKVKLTDQPTNNVSAMTKLPTASVPESSFSVDQSYTTLGSYQNASLKSPELSQPFASLFTSRTTKERTFAVNQTQSTSTLTTPLPQGAYTLSLPSYFDTTTLLPVNISAKINGTIVSLDLTIEQPRLQIDSQTLPHETRHTQLNFTVPATSKDFYLDVNNSDFFHLENLKDSYTKVGSTYLSNVDKLNYLRLYDGKPKAEGTLGVKSFDPGKNCGVEKPTAAVSSTVSDDTITLSATNTANCTVYSTPLSGLSNSLIRVSFDYQSSSDEVPQYCYYSQATNSCLNKKDIVRTGFATDMTPFSDFFENANTTDDKGFFHLITEGQADEDKNQTKSTTYKNIKIAGYPYISGTSLSLADLKDQARNYHVTIPKDAKLSVTLQTPEAYATYVNPVSRNLYKKSALNYDSALPGKFTLTELDQTPKMLQASAQDASSYILLRANNLTAGNGYLMRLTTKHEEGFPFTLNVFTNQEFRSYAYTYTSTSRDVRSDYFVLPPLYAFDDGMSVLLGSNSYNSTPSTNDLIDMSVVPLPFDYLTQMNLRSSNNSVPKATVLPVSVTKNNLSSYTVTPSPKTQELILSQGYNAGWHAYALNSKPGLIATHFPSLFGTELPHHEVNSWENGWSLIPQDATKHIVIVYTPQITESIGLGLLGVGTVVILGISLLRLKFDRKSQI